MINETKHTRNVCRKIQFNLSSKLKGKIWEYLQSNKTLKANKKQKHN